MNAVQVGSLAEVIVTTGDDQSSLFFDKINYKH